jgi:hypothetical protein
MSTQRHKVFISYHHSNDQYYKQLFCQLFSEQHDILVDVSVEIGDIDPNSPTETIRQRIRNEYLRDSTVTVVLIGSETLKRKHVDWEIYSSLRDTSYNPRSGLLGIILPTYYNNPENRLLTISRFNHHTIPPRLSDNINSGFAKIYSWSNNATEVQNWIHSAFLNRKNDNIDLKRPLFAKNRSENKWTS